MLRRYPFALVFLLTALFICSAYYWHFPFDLRAGTEADYLDSLRVFRVQVIEPPVVKQNSRSVTVRLLDYSQQAILYIRSDSAHAAPTMGDLLYVHTRITRPRALFIGDFDYGNYLRLQGLVGVGYVQPDEWQCIGHSPVRTLRGYATTVQHRLAQRYQDAGLSEIGRASCRERV